MKVKELKELCEAQLCGKVIPVYCRLKRDLYCPVTEVDSDQNRLILKGGYAPKMLDKLSIQELYYKLYRLTNPLEWRNDNEVIFINGLSWCGFQEMKKILLPADGWAWVLINDRKFKNKPLKRKEE